MKIRKSDEVEAKVVNVEGAENATVRWLVSAEDGAPTFAMRKFEVAPGGCTPHHSHAHEHEIYVLSGSGVCVTPSGEQPISTGDAIYVEPGDDHQFKNTGQQTMEFLCMVPNGSY